MGSCNCGNLAQELTRMTKDQIHQYAMQRYGDWNEQVADYCETSQLPFDIIINQMIEAGGADALIAKRALERLFVDYQRTDEAA